MRSNCPSGRHPANLSKRCLGVLDGAQHERRHDRVERCVGHREIVGEGGDHGRPTVRAPHQPPPHGRVRLGEDQLRQAERIVRHVQACSRADLEHTPACMAEQRTPMVPHPGVLPNHRNGSYSSAEHLAHHVCRSWTGIAVHVSVAMHKASPRAQARRIARVGHLVGMADSRAGQSRPRRAASATAAEREVLPSLRRTLATCR